MTLATSAAPLNSARRDTSVSGTRAVFSSQQLMEVSKLDLPCFLDSIAWQRVSSQGGGIWRHCAHGSDRRQDHRARIDLLSPPLGGGLWEDMPPANPLSNA